MNLKKCSGIQY
uniref:Uncharacterized protein n=1 Tax=Arundo donax TaxID=35708 RepID=A0A0A8ZPY7_ARUDO